MLTSDLVEKVKRIQLVTGRHVSDVLAGAYLSVFKGRGMEFDEVRPYVPGDDVRSIDWNVTARMGEPYIKRYVEERELTVMLLVDVSASLDFGSGSRSKLEAAVELSALIAFSAIQNQDKIGLLLFHGEADEYMPPRKGQKHALHIIREVLARGEHELPPRRRWNPFNLPRHVWHKFMALRDTTKPQPGNSGGATESRRSTSIARALEFCGEVLPRRTVLFLISDFIDDGYVDALRSANRRHDLVAVLINDERELAFDKSGLITLQDAETGATRLVDTSSKSYRAAVADAAAQRLQALETSLRSSNIDLVQIDAARPVIDPLIEFFDARKRRRRR